MKRHTWAIIVSIVVGLLFITPQLFFKFSLGDEYKGIRRVISGDETFYMVRAQEIVDGHYTLSSPYFAELKQSAPAQFFIGDFIVAAPARVFSIDTYALYEVYDFIFPAVLFLLAYCIFFLLSRNTFWSVAVSSWILLVQHFILFHRPISPQINFIFVLTLIFFLLNLEKKNKRFWMILFAGINFGFLFYLYAYYWTYFAFLLIALALYLFWQKKITLAQRVLYIFGLGLLIGMPYLFQTWQISKLDIFLESVARLGLLSTRFPSGFQIVIPVIIVLFFFAYYFRKKKIRFKDISYTQILLVIGVFSGIAMVNQHIITGKNLLFSSHYETISLFFVYCGFIYLVFHSKIFEKVLRWNWLRLAAIGFITLSFWAPYKDLLETPEEETSWQRYAPVFDWLNEITAKDSVVSTYGELSDLIPAYTHNNVTYNALATLSFVSHEEILDRFTLYNFWQKEFDEEFAKRNLFGVHGIQYLAQRGKAKQENKIRNILKQEPIDIESVSFPQDKIDEIVEYRQGLTEEDWIQSFKKYQVDYYIYDMSETRDLSITLDDLDQYKFLEPMYNTEGIYVYGVDHSEL